MDECFSSVGEEAIFSTLNANIGYWQDGINKAMRDKAAFTSHHCLISLIRMSFEFRIASGTLQQTMDVFSSIVR